MAPKKDHCPFCYTEVQIGSIKFDLGPIPLIEVECFECPNCQERFMTIPQVEQLLRKIEEAFTPKDQG